MAKKPFFSHEDQDKSRSVPGDNPTPPPADPEQVQTNLLEQIKNLLARPVVISGTGDEKSDKGDVGSAIVMGILLLGILVLGFFLIKPLFAPKPVNPAYAKVEAIKRIKELTLVKHHYETILPITKGNKEKLQFLIVAPSEVRGFVDLSKLRYSINPDSLILITLPEPEISQTIISVRNTKEYTFQRSFWGQMKEKFDPKSNYLEAYDKIRTALDSASLDVHRRAIINGILDDTEDKAEEYITNMVNNLGYRVEFVKSDQPVAMQPDSLEKMYQQIFSITDPEQRKALEKKYFRFLPAMRPFGGR
ncbi:MAG: DUF4230 domain-containing protein [Bacteroidia bacterium]